MLPGYKSAKRFYKEASAEALEGRARVLLDGRPLRSPMKRELLLPSLALAEAIAAEWARQVDKIDAGDMPLMALACTAVDRIGPNREAIEGELLGYGGNDLLCYWAEGPEALVERQSRAWRPLLDWAAAEHGARLRVSAGILHRPQPETALEALGQVLRGLDDFRLAALSSAVANSGSLVLGLALVARRLSAEEVFAAAELEALYQQELWGLDLEAKRRQDGLFKEFKAAEEFISLF